MKITRFLVTLLVIFFLGPALPSQAQVSPADSMISTVQTAPDLRAGDQLTVSVWLLDANGRLQDQETRPVYVWLEALSSPGLMSPALGDGDPYVTLDVAGSLFDEGLLVTLPGTYTLHASLYPPQPVQVATGTQVELTNPDLHPIQVGPGGGFSLQAFYHLQTNLPPDFRIKIPYGEPGLAIHLTLSQRAGIPYPANSPVTLSNPDGRLRIDPDRHETNSQGEISFRLEGLVPGESQLVIQTGNRTQSIPVDVASREALYFINRSKAVFTGGKTYLDAVPVIRQDRTYIPLRSLIEAFGGSVDYEGGQMTVSLGDQAVVMTLGQRDYLVNGHIQTMDAAPYLETNAYRTMVPVRFLAEGLGLSVAPQYAPGGYVEAVHIQA